MIRLFAYPVLSFFLFVSYASVSSAASLVNDLSDAQDLLKQIDASNLTFDNQSRIEKALEKIENVEAQFKSAALNLPTYAENLPDGTRFRFDMELPIFAHQQRIFLQDHRIRDRDFVTNSDHAFIEIVLRDASTADRIIPAHRTIVVTHVESSANPVDNTFYSKVVRFTTKIDPMIKEIVFWILPVNIKFDPNPSQNRLRVDTLLDQISPYASLIVPPATTN